ncbi:MAG: sulfotransferase [Luteolibacter sp.]|uniref:tetratricopeptide repeat-containing sulfotransferase family protein n=1 Tax=Luteolibacter sp. TaxID=1962973 RepID=UPI003265693F
MNPNNDLVALQRSPRDRVRWRKAREKLLGGHCAAALSDYRELVRHYAGVPELWFEFGNAASGALDFPLANQAYRRALELAPGNASLLSSIGHQYQGLRQLDDARSCFEKAVVANPDSVDARINLAVWLEKERRLPEAWEQVEACLARHPRDDQARYFRAFLRHRRKETSLAEMELRDLIKDGPRYPYVKYASRHLLGVVLDELGHYQEAMHWLLEAKMVVRTLTDTSALERGYDEGERRRQELMASLTSKTIRSWREEAPASEGSHRFAFLGGHPRSGTTLLEQILGANPEVMAFDEPVGFAQEIAGHPKMAGRNSAHALDQLPATIRAGMRQRYVQSLMREVPGENPARMLLDKNPSPTSSLPVWLRVFPELKVIISLRDPRDVVISCFFLNIMLNATNANFLSMERTAKHYADLMGIWLRMRDLGGFDWIESRYEDVVEDLETEGKKVTRFLGLDWHPDQARHEENASGKILFAPTYHDVTRKVYSSAVGRWERYAKEMEPVRAMLEPFCQAFGYRI